MAASTAEHILTPIHLLSVYLQAPLSYPGCALFCKGFQTFFESEIKTYFSQEFLKNSQLLKAPEQNFKEETLLGEFI